MALKSVLKVALKSAGYSVVRLPNDVRFQCSYAARDLFSAYGIQELRQVISMVQTSASTMCSERRLLSLGQIVKYLELKQIPGALIECGVWKGGAAAVMAAANLAYGTQRRTIHLFDSFTDIVEPDPQVDGKRALYEVEQFAGRSRESLTGALKPIIGMYDSHGGPGNPEAVKSLLTGTGFPESMLQLHVGYFQDTIPAFSPTQPVALLRIDADWYRSTKICLDHLADRMSPGSIVIVDDYGAYDGCATAVNEYLSLHAPVLLNWVDSECVYFTRES